MSRFLDEALASLVRASREALELAGHQIVDPPVEYGLSSPEGVTGRPAIVGDIQSRDSNGRATAFYVRTRHVDALIPEWLSTMVRESHELENMPHVYVIAETDVSESDVRDAETCGAGILRLEANRRLMQVVAVGPPTDEMTDQEFDAAVDELRSAAVSASVLNQGRILDEFTRAPVVGPVSQQRRDQLIAEHAGWRDWQERRTHELDQLKRSKSRQRLIQVEAEIRNYLATH